MKTCLGMLSLHALSALLALSCTTAEATVPLQLSSPNCSAAHVAIHARSPGMPRDGIFNFDIYAPLVQGACAHGNFPVVFFVTGFGANVPASLYSDLLLQLVQRGFIIVGMHRVGYPKYHLEGLKLLDVLDWAQAGLLRELMSQHELAAIPDVIDRTAVMAQSSGNHIIGEALVTNCSLVKAFVMIDPVDGVDPFGFDTSHNLITPGEMLGFTIPGLLLNNGLDPQKLNFLYPPCAPPALSNDRFYNAWRGPIWNINATAYGHVDCFNDGDATSFSHLVCPANSRGDKKKYRAMLADAANTFLSGVFERSAEKLRLLEDPSRFDVDVIMKHSLKGLSLNEIKPGCSNAEIRDITVVI
eukprot:TRINITY_DN14194_c0_g3_i1.p1 TRINITY_DN14194_c0_g3~~TRINITY_DN14194_c0_g3_i1.p1  ORF type:complete len:357 (-),score=30.71 TRINITY_DN14194_c0_g3_i1:59-1129(-)